MATAMMLLVSHNGACARCLRIQVAYRLTDQTNFLDLASSTSLQPIVVDYNGTMKPDLLGYAWSKNNQLSLWSPVGKNSQAYVPLRAFII